MVGAFFGGLAIGFVLGLCAMAFIYEQFGRGR